MKEAKEYDASKENDYTISDLRPDIVYKLRVYGYSRGGMGAMSSPTMKFLLGSFDQEHSVMIGSTPSRNSVRDLPDVLDIIQNIA